MEEKIQRLLAWVRDDTPADRDIFVPVSGGTDSALCFWLYASAFPQRTVGIHFGDGLRERAWFESVGTIRSLPQPEGFRSDEVGRWAELLDRSLAEGARLVGTRNRTEEVLGTYSTASRIALHQPLANVWKSDVLLLCAHIGVPEAVIASSREADVACGRPEALAKIPFAAADAFAKEKLGLHGEPAALDAAQRSYLEALYAHNRFKSRLPVLGPEL